METPIFCAERRSFILVHLENEGKCSISSITDKLTNEMRSETSFSEDIHQYKFIVEFFCILNQYVEIMKIIE